MFKYRIHYWSTILTQGENPSVRTMDVSSTFSPLQIARKIATGRFLLYDCHVSAYSKTQVAPAAVIGIEELGACR